VTDRYAVTGSPLGHTKSPLIHGTFAGETGQDITYEAIEAPLDGFKAVIDAFRTGGGRGINVTTPFKLEAFAYATEVSARARIAGAANALAFDGERVRAENFGGVGLVNDIQRNRGFPHAGRRVLLMGAGGAVRGATLPLLEQRPALLVIANRTVAKAKALGEQFSDRANLVTEGYPDLGAQVFDIVINATSVCWSGRRRKRSNGGAACAQRPGL
jgi:shikimate dehydrogenase